MHGNLALSFIKAPPNCVITPPATLALSTGSLATLETERNWLKSCSVHHGVCNRRGLTDAWYPTRLLDLGEPDSTSWKLCIVREDGVVGDAPPRYMTLSYRWARDPSIVLTRDGLNTFEQGLPIDGLPLLFRHVISVVRFFGFRYLWIDALCIVQDWLADWEREATMMHLVYSNSVCNIAASAADGPHESLFRDRDQKHIEAGMVEASFFSMDNVKRAYVVTERNYCERQLRGPLNHRGWVMQERFLAPRVLYFGSDQVVWECLTENASEVFPLGQPGSSPVKRINALWNFVGPRPAAGTASMSDELLSAWTSVIKEYASCQLTYPTDKIFAMTGVAQVFAEISGDVFVAGMWKTRMASMFDWWITDGGRMNPTPSTRLDNPIAPSFSWASVDGLLVLFRQADFEDLLETLAVIMPSGNQLASLRMRGRLFMMAKNPRFAPRPGNIQTEPEYILASSLQGDWGTDCEVPAPSTRFIAWNTSGDVPSDDEVVIVISRRKLPQHLSGIFLVRCSSDEAEHKYRRVGYADIRCDDDQFEKLLEVETTDFIWI